MHPQTIAAISKGSIAVTAKPIPAIITLAETNVVSMLSVKMIARLYFLYKAFLKSFFLMSCFLSLIFYASDNFAHLRWVILGKSELLVVSFYVLSFIFFSSLLILSSILLSSSVNTFHLILYSYSISGVQIYCEISSFCIYICCAQPFLISYKQKQLDMCPKDTDAAA